LSQAQGEGLSGVVVSAMMPEQPALVSGSYPQFCETERGRQMESWMQNEIDNLVSEYGTVPPPWVLYNEHPFSICWRMGGGESHIELWWMWWLQQKFSEDQKIDYFRKWPPPHCWLVYLLGAIWGIDKFDDNPAMYFERASALGFGNQQDYERDLRDPRWHKRNV
jgi:hypothetical protein